ncbi:MAG TPA: AsnC family transcriptional regulator, partial [Gammaproteobacteria bacterium]
EAGGGVMDRLDRNIINTLQQGFPICDRPYAEVAAQLGTSEEELLARLQRLLDEGLLTRFGPMYHAEQMGGGLTLAAMQVPEWDFERVSEMVNRHPEVAHNYQRDHALNMWFVLATETPERIAHVIDAIERETRYPVFNMPKQREFYIGLRFVA